MKPKSHLSILSRLLAVNLSRALFVGAVFLFLAASAKAQLSPGGGGKSGPTYTALDAWVFDDYTNWTSVLNYAPVSFTNLSLSYLGNGRSLVMDTNVPAWLQYNVFENDGTTNLTVDQGTIDFWFAPTWSSTNAGGSGPGVYGRLIEIGSYTPDSSYGWWSIYVDDVGQNIYFSAQTNDLSSNVTTYVSAPISWTTNYFHDVTVTYSATNTALYLDGVLATNGPGMTVYPGLNVLTNGFYIGSDTNGVLQAHGMFNNVYTYNTPLDADTIGQYFHNAYMYYMMSPWNMAMAKISNANSAPSVTPTPNVVTGQGNLQILGATATCSYGTNAFNVWITNITASVASDGTMNVTFAIAGGWDGYYYDVFVGTSLTSPLKNGYWTWQGQGQHCLVYSLSNLPQGTVFLALGTPQDTDGDGLTDAYENLVSKTDPNNPDTDGDGIPDGWSVLLGLNPLTGVNTSPSARANYSYTSADWLNGVSGVKTGTITTDNEGNVQSVSQ